MDGDRWRALLRNVQTVVTTLQIVDALRVSLANDSPPVYIWIDDDRIRLTLLTSAAPQDITDDGAYLDIQRMSASQA